MWLFVIFVATECWYGTNGEPFKKYVITHGERSAFVPRCILKYTKTTCVAIRIRDLDGDCTCLTSSWAANNVFYPGHTYAEKQTSTVVTSFSLSNPIGELLSPNKVGERVWSLPTHFNKGGNMSISISTSTDENWKSFQLRMSDLPANAVQYNESNGGKPAGLMLVSITFDKVKDEGRFTTYDKTRGWKSYGNHMTCPIEDESTYLLTMIARENDLQVLLDGEELAVLMYIAPPETMKTLLIRNAASSQWPLINNITMT